MRAASLLLVLLLVSLAAAAQNTPATSAVGEKATAPAQQPDPMTTARLQVLARRSALEQRLQQQKGCLMLRTYMFEPTDGGDAMKLTGVRTCTPFAQFQLNRAVVKPQESTAAPKP